MNQSGVSMIIAENSKDVKPGFIEHWMTAIHQDAFDLKNSYKKIRKQKLGQDIQ